MRVKSHTKNSELSEFEARRVNRSSTDEFSKLGLGETHSAKRTHSNIRFFGDNEEKYANYSQLN